MKTLRNSEGFTLVEMLTVVVIIGILAGILFKIGPMIANRGATSIGASRLEHLKLCIEHYHEVYGEYPRATGVTWEEPGGSAGTPEDWDIILPGGQANNPAWENPDKEYWTELYPYIYVDVSSVEWEEFSSQAGGDQNGIAVNEADSGDLGFEYGAFIYTNQVWTIRDGQGGIFNYISEEPYQTYELTTSTGMGEGWTE
jgi:prepilin-type N-terminal cleavage/methylation domain-containing protein